MKFTLINNGKYLYFRSMFGGKPVIGEGRDGIALKPDIKHDNNNYVSKLFILPKNISIEEFTKLEENLNKYDTLNRYHIPMIDIPAKITSQTYRVREHLARELNEEVIGKYIYIATYQYGGLSLDQIIANSEYDSFITPFFCMQLLNGFLYLYDGIIHFAQYGINHSDIHTGNIVLDLQNPSIMRFIDFNTDPRLEPSIERWLETRFSQVDLPFPKFNMIFVQDIIDLLSMIEIVISKLLIIFEERKNQGLVDYLQCVLLIIEESYYKLSHDYDVNNIVIIKQTLTDKFGEIESFLDITN
jgi:hypothetical protein